MTKKVIKFFLKLAISLGFSYWVIIKIEWTESWEYLKQVQAWQIALYLLLVVAGMLISAHKWKILANHKNIYNSFFDFFKFYLTGSFVNNFMPSFIGGDTYRAYQIGRVEKKYAVAASTVVMDRITGLIGATILALFFSLLNWKTVLKNNWLIFFNAVIILSLFFDIIAMKVRESVFLQKLFRKFIPEKIRHFFNELDAYRNDHGVLGRAIFWGCLFALIGVALANFVLLKALGVQIGFLDFLSVIFLITIVSSIPITINNIGLKEWAFVTFFGLFGVNSSLIIIAAILSRFLQMALSFSALPMYLKSRKKMDEKL
ncbi:MAG TPA: hypothetical protein DCS28_00440 [Candidatus Moranbacteria bacterium]|nr:hypothetical protein [Candidatus Moranbacteria bacterium]HAT74499.1 hypothetical protein [Candidatus Moranbacteria bacterium]